jgi:hypothetical protein
MRAHCRSCPPFHGRTPVMTMTRRSLIMSAVLSALPTATAKWSSIESWWSVRVRRRWELASHFRRSARSRERFVAKCTELYKQLELIEVDPSRSGELRRDLDNLRLMVERNVKRAEHDTRLAALYRRAAFRPWQELPPRPKLEIFSEKCFDSHWYIPSKLPPFFLSQMRSLNSSC